MTQNLYTKTKKLIKTPGLFFRDFFNKKYPTYTNEQKISQEYEFLIVQYDLQLASLEAKLNIKTDPVDVVFTWVNNQDSEWIVKYQQAHKNVATPIGLHADDQARFDNHNELYYSVHSVLKFLPWVRKIFIVTDNQTPNWYNREQYDNITLINHHQIINSEYLPTFNSHIIEAHLHKIPDLSENFIYFNDDVFVARSLPKEHFFASNGNASIFLADKSLRKMRNKGVMTPTLFACENCQLLLKETHQACIDMPLVHTYIPLKKSYFEKAWQLYYRKIIEFLPNKFRSNNDLNLASFLVPYLMYLDGKSSARTDICYYFNVRTNNAKVQYKNLLKLKEEGKQPHSFCANDFYSINSVPNYHQNLESMLIRYFDLNQSITS